GLLVVEPGQDEALVDHVVVHVGSQEAFAAAADVDWFGQFHQFELLAAGVDGRLQDLVRLVVGGGPDVLGRVLGRGTDHNDTGLGEAGQCVDVVIGDVLALDAFDPDEGRRADGLLQSALDVGSGLAGIAVVVDQGALGGHEGACAVDLDGAALGDDGCLDPGD